jgi:plastocyanin
MDTETKEAREVSPSTEAPRSAWFSRLPFSTLEKIALWTAIVMSLAGVAGVTALSIASGAPSRDSVTGLICSLAIVILLATRMRWAPVVTSIIGAYNLYLIATEPYAVASLSDPKGPDGGFGKFIGVVIVLACALVVLGCSIGAAIQNYRQGGRQAPRWLPSGMTLVAGLAIGAIFIGALSLPPTPTGTTYTNGVPTVHMNATNFDQPTVTIPKGSKLLLVDDTSVVHILDNGSWQNGQAQKAQEAGAPLVNNLQLSSNSVEIGPFNTAGTFHIFCIVHQGMNLTIIVQ